MENLKIEISKADNHIIKEERERTKHNDVKKALDIDCIDDIMGEMDSVNEKEHKKKVKILTKKGKIELNGNYE